MFIQSQYLGRTLLQLFLLLYVKNKKTYTIKNFGRVQTFIIVYYSFIFENFHVVTKTFKKFTW